MINNALDIDYWRTRLQREGRIQIGEYLQPAAAERLRECLVREVPWTLALRDENGSRTIDHAGYAAMSPEAIARLLADVARSARDVTDGDFSFAYESYMMVRAYKEQRDPDLPLHRVLELFNSPPYLTFMRRLVGNERVRRLNAQATRYRPGHFLRVHSDENESEGRLFAYVLNLSQGWQADWGGLLQFVDAEGRVEETYLPRWNTLSLFAVPKGHTVSLVAPWAADDRLAITGWLLR
jgi:Rps23 Pro-64 3,4-dihydroxylase Tpa1-like proline 4-hydroxylase